jgi:hypothetical protein
MTSPTCHAFMNRLDWPLLSHGVPACEVGTQPYLNTATGKLVRIPASYV